MPRRKKIFIVLILSLIFLIFIKSRNLSNLFPVDTTIFNNKYSNGWYDFSFRYPDSAKIQTPLDYQYQYKGYKVVSNKVDVREVSSGMPGSEPCTIKVYHVGNQSAPRISNEVSVNLGEYQWNKRRYVSDASSLLFRYEGVIWAIEKNSYLYVGRSTQDNEKWCEAILSTVDFHADDAIESAKQASNAKDVATNYIIHNYPSMKYKAGYFIVTDESGGTSVLDYTGSAIVEFAESPNSIRRETRALQISKVDNVWKVVGETDSF